MADLMTHGLSRQQADVNTALRQTWPELHGPRRHWDTARLVALFRHAGYVSDGPLRPHAGLMVYRGELAGSPDPGISWSTDKAVAVKFAQGWASAGLTVVWQAVAPPDSVLARFGLEDEVVVQPDLLADVASLGGFEHFTWPPS